MPTPREKRVMAVIERVEHVFRAIEAFDCEQWLNRLESQSVKDQIQARIELQRWLRDWSSLARARVNRRMSSDQVRHFQELLRRRGEFVYALGSRGLRVPQAVFEAARLCA